MYTYILKVILLIVFLFIFLQHKETHGHDCLPWDRLKALNVGLNQSRRKPNNVYDTVHFNMHL